MVDLDKLKNFYFCNSFDVPYDLKKGNTILIKPILLKDYPIYEWSKQILEIQKNEINDIKIIQMSYLDFIINVCFNSIPYAKEQLQTLLNLCLGVEYISFGVDNNKNCIIVCDKDGIILNVINHKEFDDISKIILNQNDYKYDNRYINPEVRELLNDYYKIKYSNIHSPTLEQKKSFVCSKIGKTFSDINNMPYREFDLMYNSALNSEIYLTTKITEASYKYEVKEQTIHPLFTKDKDPYEEAFESSDILASKGISGAEQLTALNLQK